MLLDMVKQAKKGDKESFASLISLYRDDAYRLAYVYLQHEHDSMDAVCNAVEKCWRKLPGLKKEESFKSWFFKIIVNEALTIIKSRKRIIATPDSELELYAIPPPQDDSLLLSQLLGRIGLADRRLVSMKYLLGYTLKEIADISGLPEGTVKTKIYSCLKKMNGQLSGEV